VKTAKRISDKTIYDIRTGHPQWGLKYERGIKSAQTQKKLGFTNICEFGQ